MNYIGIIVGLVAWFFIDVYLGLQIKKIANSEKKKMRKLALIALNVVLAIVAIIITISIQ